MKIKQTNVAILAIALGLSMSFSSCKEDGDGPKNETDTIMTGNITADKTLTADVTWYLRGDVIVKEGATLTIEPGTTIIADAEVITYLLVEQGAQIIANGTADKPIVFTSDVKESGAWGGLHICGKAPINVSGGVGSSEIGDAAYGGTVATDNSGSLKYVRIEYSGTALDDEHEANGLTLYGVGSGTTIEYIQIYYGADDGIEFFGGTVNVKYAYVFGVDDDCFDWTQGWAGKGQYWLAEQLPLTGDRGIEADNSSSNNTASPYSNPTISQVTLIGGYSETDTIGKAGIKLREGTKGKLYNVIVTGFDKRSVDVEHDQTLLNVVDGSLLLDYAYVNSGVSDVAFKYSASKVNDVSNPKPDGLSAVQFETSANITSQVVTKSKSATFTGGKDMSQDSFFSADTKIGSGNTWTVGWTR